jgi:SET domain-containing protein
MAKTKTKSGKSKSAKSAVKSEWAKVKSSGIHNKGLFAKRDIPEGTRIIEYVGEKLTTAESERRGVEQDELARETGGGTVYMFTLNSRFTIDGNVSWNTAKYANHGCDPNAETDVIKGRIWLIALHDIKKGEEIVYDYSFDIEYCKDYPCLCGAKNCAGYIVGWEFRAKLKRKLKAERKKKQGQKKDSKRKKR